MTRLLHDYQSPLKVFIGFDARESIAYHVLAHSILWHASAPISVTPVVRRQFKDYIRPRNPLESTDFSITRFLVPAMAGYSGWALFLDCDMLCQVDLNTILREPERDPGKAVYVVQHDYTPTSTVKFLNEPQSVYPRKNWSSVMLFDASQCQALTMDYVNEAPALDLHRFHWLRDDQIGALPLEWNWLVSEYPPNDRAKILHWTLGGPWFCETKDVDHADRWRHALEMMQSTPNQVHV